MDVLLVDSDPSILDVTRSVLAGRADRLSTASSVSEAVATLEGGSIDVFNLRSVLDRHVWARRAGPVASLCTGGISNCRVRCDQCR